MVEDLGHDARRNVQEELGPARRLVLDLAILTNPGVVRADLVELGAPLQAPDRDDEGGSLELTASEAEAAESGPGTLGVVAASLDGHGVYPR